MASMLLLPDEQRYRQDFLTMLFRGTTVLSPVSALVYLVNLIRNPSWAPGIAVVESILATAFAVWALRRVRLGEVMMPMRLFLGIAFALSLGFMMVSSPTTSMGGGGVTFALMILLAAILDIPGAAIWWTLAGGACYLVGLFFPRVVHIPAVELAAGDLVGVQITIVIMLLLVGLLGRSAMRHLHLALVNSERGRHEMAQANVELQRQKVELQRSEAALAATATDLERRNRELRSFAQVIAHDLRAPLRALSQYSQFLEADCAAQLDARCVEYVQGIGESARHMDAMVGALLEYSRVGREAEPPEDVELGALLDGLVKRLALREQAEVRLPASAPTLRVSPLSLEQLLFHLLSNAMKFRRPGVPAVVSVELVEREREWEIGVRDNGIGIEAKHFERIFGIFERLHMRGAYEGTGIGLAIAKKAVEAWGGRIWVESQVGEGSAFWFTVPRKDAPPVERTTTV